MNRLLVVFLGVLILSAPAVNAQQKTARLQNKSSLTIQQIMEGERFVGFWPESVTWTDDSRTLYFTWNPAMDTLRSWHKVGISGGVPQKLTQEERAQSPVAGSYSADYQRKVFARNGDLFLLDVRSGQITPITQTEERESGPVFAGDDRRVIYQRENNLYVWDSADGSTRQLTSLRAGVERKEPRLNDQQQWLEDDQLALFERLRWREGQDEIRRREREALQPKRPKAYYYGKNRVMRLSASPDLNYVFVLLSKPAEDKNTIVPDYVTKSGFTTDLNTREKVGGPQDTYELVIYNTVQDSFYTLDTKQIPGIRDKPAFLRDYHRGDQPFVDQYDKPREVAINGPIFSTTGNAAVVVRSLDNKDRWIMLLDPATGKLDLIDRQHDDAWIGGPGVGNWNFATGIIDWLPDGQTLWFASEETGFSHLYSYSLASKTKQALTQGNFEILDAQLSHDKNYFYLTANAEGPAEQHFYRLPVKGGSMERLTTLPGNNEVQLSPDEQYLAIRNSYSNKPWEVYVQENKPGAQPRQLTASTTAAFQAYSWRDPEIVRFTARDGVAVPARLYKPTKGKSNGAAVIFVHGAGYLQNVHRWWSSYFREYMFHHLLVDNGYTVMDIDYRGSAGYGRDWRTAIYRHMGGQDLDDQVDGAKFLAAKHGVDAKRVGIYGGSYGGFITLMALFNAPETFASGAAIRSVTDWAHYNHGYTANILNTPVEDSLAYRRSSPIYFADGLQGNLLMLHGMVDVNVHFQDVVRLSQRLIELGKDKWELAVFPLEDHGFVEPSSWTDEYKRIFKLFQETLR